MGDDRPGLLKVVEPDLIGVDRREGRRADIHAALGVDEDHVAVVVEQDCMGVAGELVGDGDFPGGAAVGRRAENPLLVELHRLADVDALGEAACLEGDRAAVRGDRAVIHPVAGHRNRKVVLVFVASATQRTL
ncbi:hypothetical protein D3C80_1383460 [compost metagenome]